MKRPSSQPAAGHALAVLAASTALAAFGFGLATPAAAADARSELVKRGQHLVQTSGCHDCHTPMKMGANGPEPDMDRMLSGHPEGLVMPPAPTLPPGPWLVVSSATNTAFSGPWGVSFTANLTPDADTGLGQWKASDFKATIRSGRHMGRGRPVLPPMPIPAYQNFSDAELDAVFAYLRTVPAVKNRVPEPVAAVAAMAAPAKP